MLVQGQLRSPPMYRSGGDNEQLEKQTGDQSSRVAGLIIPKACTTVVSE